uniref:Transposase n=1 Tax=Steinernema glaseri TaxID=37863 RepID=A0A1I7ZY84_9BILA
MRVKLKVFIPENFECRMCESEDLGMIGTIKHVPVFGSTQAGRTSHTNVVVRRTLLSQHKRLKIKVKYHLA